MWKHLRDDGNVRFTISISRSYKDKDDGDAYGQGIRAFGADWYVLAPSGKKIDNS